MTETTLYGPENSLKAFNIKGFYLVYNHPDNYLPETITNEFGKNLVIKKSFPDIFLNVLGNGDITNEFIKYFKTDSWNETDKLYVNNKCVKNNGKQSVSTKGYYVVTGLDINSEYELQNGDFVYNDDGNFIGIIKDKMQSPGNFFVITKKTIYYYLINLELQNVFCNDFTKVQDFDEENGKINFNGALIHRTINGRLGLIKENIIIECDGYKLDEDLQIMNDTGLHICSYLRLLKPQKIEVLTKKSEYKKKTEYLTKKQ